MAKQSCVARLLDVRAFVVAARAGTAQAEPGALVLMVLGFGLISLMLLPVWVAYDLNSTWEFTTALRDGAAPVIEGAAYSSAGWLDVSIGMFLAGVILTSFTLLPSLFELCFPTASHPLLSLGLWASIIFDFTTDWGKAWETTAAWANGNVTLHYLYALLFCWFMSLLVQALLVICLTFVTFGIIGLVRSRNGGGRGMILEH